MTLLQDRRARFCPCSEHRPDCRGADHHRIAYHVVHLIALQHCLGERDVEVRFRRRIARTANPDANDILRRRLHNRLELVAASVEDAHTGSGAKPQHARQVLSLLFGQRHQIAGGLRLRGEETRVHGRDYTARPSTSRRLKPSFEPRLFFVERASAGATCTDHLSTIAPTRVSPLLYSPHPRCSFAVKPWASTASSRHSGAAASAPSIWQRTRGSTRRSRSRFRT